MILSIYILAPAAVLITSAAIALTIRRERMNYSEYLGKHMGRGERAAVDDDASNRRRIKRGIELSLLRRKSDEWMASGEDHLAEGSHALARMCFKHGQFLLERWKDRCRQYQREDERE